MVGDDGCHHDVGERKQHGRQYCRVCPTQLYDVPEYAEHEHEGVEGAQQQRYGYYELHQVDAGKSGEPCVKLRQRPHHERQQRVAVDVVVGRPVRNHRVGYGVEARDCEVLDENVPVAGVRFGEQVDVARYDEGVQSDEHHKRHGRREPFFALYLE